MKPDRTKVFLRFFFGFVTIIALAFGVLVLAGYQLRPVDNVASQQ